MSSSHEEFIVKTRLLYLALAFITMLLGLASRANNITLPDFIATYAGDTLWAMLVFWLVRAIAPTLDCVKSALIAIAFSFFIEFLQFYHAPWIDSIRATTLGGLVLGFGFKASDLICYTTGIMIAYLLDRAIVSRFNK
ncbi:MAG: DUF2809 domain-containing protein [Leucothrix sp.]